MAAAPRPRATPMVVQPLPIAPVVGSQFCEPSTLVLTINKAFSFSGGDFMVSDANNRKILQVEGYVGFQPKRVLFDTAFTPIISMRRSVMSMRGTWKAYRGDGSDPKELLFTVQKSSIFQLATTLDVFLAKNITQQRCDFKVKASWSWSSCTFYLGDSDTVIARMERQYKLKNVLLGGTLNVTVYPNVDYAFVVAVIVILDEIERSNRSAGSSGGVGGGC